MAWAWTFLRWKHLGRSVSGGVVFNEIEEERCLKEWMLGRPLDLMVSTGGYWSLVAIVSSIFKLFNWSVMASKVNLLWKTSIIYLVYDRSNPKALRDFRQEAPTSLVLKYFECILLMSLVNQIQQQLEPLQFGCKHSISTEDVIITLLNQACTHLESSGSFVHILFADYSSAHGAVQRHFMTTEMSKLGVNYRLILLVNDFLVWRVQSVRCRNDRAGPTVFSSSRTVCTGAHEEQYVQVRPRVQ